MNDEAKAVRSETRHSRPLPSHHPLFHHPSYGEAGPQGVYDGRRAEAYGSLRSLSLRHLTYETERDMNRMPDEPRSDWKWMTTAPYIPGLVASLVVRSFRALFVRPSLTIRYASRFFSSFFTSLHRVAALRLSVLRPSLLPTVAAACGA